MTTRREFLQALAALTGAAALPLAAAPDELMSVEVRVTAASPLADPWLGRFCYASMYPTALPVVCADRNEWLALTGDWWEISEFPQLAELCRGAPAVEFEGGRFRLPNLVDENDPRYIAPEMV